MCGDQVASTRDGVPDDACALRFDETLSLVCTMYREGGAARGAAFAPKLATFSLLHGPRPHIWRTPTPCTSH